MIEFAKLEFSRGSGRSEWYQADAPFGFKYMVVKKGQSWEVYCPDGKETCFSLEQGKSAAQDNMEQMAGACFRFKEVTNGAPSVVWLESDNDPDRSDVVAIGYRRELPFTTAYIRSDVCAGKGAI